MELKEIQNLIKFVAKSGVNEVHVEMGETKVTIKTGGDVVQQVVTALLRLKAQHRQLLWRHQQQRLLQSQYHQHQQLRKLKTIITSQSNHLLLEPFYRKPSPDKPNFVEAVDQVNEGDVLCVVEAMKLFNEIESEVSGTIVKVLVDDSSPVEFDQPLFIIDPS